jgi:hypothetical protein
MAKKRTARTSIFIACEGRNTEPLYFESIAEQVEDEGNLAITIYPERNNDNPKTDALGLIREAQSRGDEFDELWVVFDKNGYTKHSEAFALAEGDGLRKKVNIVFSSIAFEHWVLLHFEKCATSFVKSDCKDAKEHSLFCGTNQHNQDCQGIRCVAGYIRQNGFCKDYSKSNNYSFYFNYKDKTGNAVKNAAWLRFKMTQKLVDKGGKIYEINPYTDVDILVKRLLGIQTNIIWADTKMAAKVGNLIIKTEKTRDGLTMTIANKGKTAFLLNAQNLDNYIQLLNYEEIKVPITIDSAILIEPNETKPVILNTESGGDTLVFKFGQEEVFIDLKD